MSYNPRGREATGGADLTTPDGAVGGMYGVQVCTTLVQGLYA